MSEASGVVEREAWHHIELRGKGSTKTRHNPNNNFKPAYGPITFRFPLQCWHKRHACSKGSYAHDDKSGTFAPATAPCGYNACGVNSNPDVGRFSFSSLDKKLEKKKRHLK